MTVSRMSLLLLLLLFSSSFSSPSSSSLSHRSLSQVMEWNQHYNRHLKAAAAASSCNNCDACCIRPSFDTSITNQLNDYLNRTGVVVRSEDHLAWTDAEAAPASFFNGDHMAPNVVYLDPPECPNAFSEMGASVCASESSSQHSETADLRYYKDRCIDNKTGEAINKFIEPTVGYVIGSHLDINNNNSNSKSTVGCNGVYYPHDANAVDRRDKKTGAACHHTQSGVRNQNFGCSGKLLDVWSGLIL